MKIKAGVDIRGIKPELVVGLMVVDSVYRRHGSELIVTSGVEGSHMPTSLHYRGLGFDCRLPVGSSISSAITVEGIVEEIRASLGRQWDVVLEETHVHVEFDPEG